jgi:hypothetical protein
MTILQNKYKSDTMGRGRLIRDGNYYLYLRADVLKFCITFFVTEFYENIFIEIKYKLCNINHFIGEIIRLTNFE